MKFLYIGGSNERQETKQMILEEAHKFFDTVLFAPLSKIKIECINGKTKLMFKGTDLTSFNACYARFFSKDLMFGEIVLDLLNQSDVFIPLTPEGFQITNHKYFTVKVLSRENIPVPVSSLAVTPQTAIDMSNKIGYPVIIKLLSGFGGKGIMLANSESEFRPVLDTLKVFKEFISTQEYVKSENYDIRCLVFGEEVFGIKRICAEGEWRTNVSRGGKAVEVELSSAMKEDALKVSAILGLGVCAVDFMETEGKYKLIEVNFAPGFVPDFFGNKFPKILMRYLYKKTKELKAKNSF
ncbi:RimK family alpha-L-glutamate ligase [Candidatus Micrarchaeota archaeon]|nr:RimK family alpha-L-glutamate ligase [Candidatus Micrarchaeota archaeon]MBU2476059.1 RimK family alpha-L-glutamate ligase [Candidatus Micrarchaeota archaeon]